MKNIFTVILLGFVLMGLRAQASDIEHTNISNTEMFNLAIDQSALAAGVSHPGPTISGLCGVEIRADSYGRIKPIQNLLAAIQISESGGVEPIVSVENDMTVLIDISKAQDLFVTQFLIKTNDGKSLKDVITETLGDNRTVVLVGVSCPKLLER